MLAPEEVHTLRKGLATRPDIASTGPNQSAGFFPTLPPVGVNVQPPMLTAISTVSAAGVLELDRVQAPTALIATNTPLRYTLTNWSHPCSPPLV